MPTNSLRKCDAVKYVVQIKRICLEGRLNCKKQVAGLHVCCKAVSTRPMTEMVICPNAYNNKQLVVL